MLRFFLAGINNQNFLMQDRETGTWWQQVSGQAILGPLKGRQLEPIPYDEISFALWKTEESSGRVLKPQQNVRYAPADWEERIQKLPVVIQTSELTPRTLIAGIQLNGKSRAYLFSELAKQSPVIDQVGSIPVLVVVAQDGKSIRAFDRRVDVETLEFFAKPDTSPFRYVDSKTGSEWDFTGRCVNGPLLGKKLSKIPVLKDFWFDWKNYNPETTIYSPRS